MAKLAGNILFTGTIGDINVYKQHDGDAYIVRRKGGPTKKQIKTKPNFVNVRRNNREFGGCATACHWLRGATRPVHGGGDTRFTNEMMKLIKTVQKEDDKSDWGKRGVLFSKFPKLFEGFNFNRHRSLDLILRNPIQLSVAKDALSATAKLPALIPGINFIYPFEYPYFNITVALALLPDFACSQHKYMPVGFQDNYPPLTSLDTGWQSTLKGMNAQEIQLQLEVKDIPATYTLLVSAGIVFGKVTGVGNDISPVKYSGAAKIMWME